MLLQMSHENRKYFFSSGSESLYVHSEWELYDFGNLIKMGNPFNKSM